DYARKNGIVLKGDLPIGVNRTSIEAWTEPQYFNLDSQAGAPPDDFSVIGQNWGFPTYNWEVMEMDNFAWWKRRFRKLSDYFDCFRIDHILGFFRIWEVPEEYVEGLCGHFNPALPLTKAEIEQYGFSFNESRFTTAHINEQFLPTLFGEYADEANTYLAQSSSRHYVLKPFCDTQRKIERLFTGKKDEASLCVKQGL
ncbi:MAG: 4-alpha-glucanotransferase, partial [Bacteroidaceae bacterium]